MNLNNINLTQIENPIITVSYPFIYDTAKLLKNNKDNIVKLKGEYLKDFLPYTNNFFGEYHLSESENKEIPIPSILKDTSVNYIEFIKDNKIKEPLHIDDIKIFIFEKSIAILSITYKMEETMTNDDYLYYHQKLSMLDKRSKQNLKTNMDKEFKYYFEFINSLILPYSIDCKNIFSRSNLHTYNLLTATSCQENLATRKFIEPLTQFRAKVDTLEIDKINANYIQQTSNIHTIANENVVLHIGIKEEVSTTDFIDKEFFNKYQNNHFLTYIISLYQVSKMQQLILKAFLKEIENEDLKNMREIKNEILHFISNSNFTKISNNSIRNNLYKFYRKAFEIKDLMDEIDAISDKITNKLETSQEKKRALRSNILNVLLALTGIGLSIKGLM